MAIPPLWVYKCNARRHSEQIVAGDWNDFFSQARPTEWGGSTTMGSRESLDILWNRMQPGDLVLAWQTDRRSAVALCRVHDLVDVDEKRQMILDLIDEPFSPPVRLLDDARTRKRLAKVGVFKPGFPRTLYETTPAEAAVILRLCGVAPTRLAVRLKSQDGPSTRVRRPPPTSGFGTKEQNARVEAAAVRAFRREYSGWKLSDRQAENCGYDILATKGSVERHVEIKGTAGVQASFIVTRNEVITAGTDPLWRLCVVTSALTAPKTHEWTAEEFLQHFERAPISYMARLRR